MSQREECNDLMVNMCCHLYRDDAAPNNHRLIKEVLRTDKCQAFHDLRHVRERTVAELNQVAPSMSLAEACASEEVCTDVTYRLKTWYKRELLRTMPWHTRAHYFINDHSTEFMIATTGAVGSVASVFYGPIAGAVTTGLTGALYKILQM